MRCIDRSIGQCASVLHAPRRPAILVECGTAGKAPRLQLREVLLSTYHQYCLFTMKLRIDALYGSEAASSASEIRMQSMHRRFCPDLPQTGPNDDHWVYRSRRTNKSNASGSAGSSQHSYTTLCPEAQSKTEQNKRTVMYFQIDSREKIVPEPEPRAD